MALSGSFTTTALTEYGCTASFTFSWTATQSIENNKSLITWSLKTNMNPSTYSRGVRKVYITQDSTQVYSQVWSYNSLYTVTGGTVLASGTNYEVTHEPDGTKAFTFNVYVNVGRSDENAWTNTGSQSVTLNTIPRASTMSLSPADPTTLTQITASVTRATDTFKHTITTSYAGSTYTLGTAKFDTSASFTIPTGIKTSMKAANASSVVLPLTLTTYSGDTVVGSKDYSLTVKAPVATVSASPASVACNANTTWTLSNTDTGLCTYTVTRSYDGTVYYTDQTKTTTTSKSNAANTAFEQYITQTPSGTITIRVTTFVGTTEVGSNTVDYTCTIPTGTYKPTLTVSSQLSRVDKISYTHITGITFLAGYDGASGEMTEGVANSSHAEIDARTITVSGNKASRTVSLNGSTATINLDTFSSSTDDYNVTVTYRITDKRGGYAEQSFNAITVRGYSKPRFNSYIVQRATSAGVVNSEGTYVNITASASAHSIKNTSSTELNGMSSITYKLGTIGTEETSGASTDGLNGTINKTAYHSTDYSITQQYTFTLTATDAVGQSTTVSYLLPKAAIALSLHKNTGVGLGTTAIASQTTIALDTTVTRGHSLTVERGNIYLGTSTATTEQNVGLYSSAGSMFIYNSGQQNKRGIRLPRHGTGSAKDVFTIDTNNDITFNGSLSGNASTATTASKLGTATVGGTATPIYLNAGSPTSVETPESGSWFKGVPKVKTDGVMEIGSMIDFHATNATADDYSARLQADGTRLLCNKDFRAKSLSKEYYGTYYPRRWCQGTSTSANKTTVASNWYYVPLTTTEAENPVIDSSNKKLFGKRSGGIQVFRAGKYKVSGSVYIGTSSGGRAGAYIFDSTDAFADGSSVPSTSTELIGNALYGNGTDVVITIAPKIITLAANHIVHIVGRTMSAAGTVYCSNKSTYLLVEWVSD